METGSFTASTNLGRNRCRGIKLAKNNYANTIETWYRSDFRKSHSNSSFKWVTRRQKYCCLEDNNSGGDEVARSFSHALAAYSRRPLFCTNCHLPNTYTGMQDSKDSVTHLYSSYRPQLGVNNKSQSRLLISSFQVEMVFIHRYSNFASMIHRNCL